MRPVYLIIVLIFTTFVILLSIWVVMIILTFVLQSLRSKGVDLTGLLGGTRKKTGGLGKTSPPAGFRGGALVGDLGDEVP